MFTSKTFVSLAAFFCLNLGAAHAQAVLEDFSSERQSGAGIPLFSIMYAGDSDGTATVQNGMYTQTVNSGAYKLIMHFVPIPGYGPRYPWPSGYARSWIRSGSWDLNYNRLRFRMRCNRTVPGNTDGSEVLHVGTYVKPSTDNPDNQGDHYYHFFNPSFYANKWVWLEVNRHPQHSLVGGFDGNNNLKDNPSSSRGINYFDGLTRFYIDTTSHWPLNGATCDFDDFTFAKDTGEPDWYISSLTYQYTGSQYKVTWNTPRRLAISYEIRYSTTSMKVSGFTSGTAAGTANSTQSDYGGATWTSAAMPEAPVMYVAIRPQGQTDFTEVEIRSSGSTAPPPSPCDSNSDGTLSSADADYATEAALGQRSCTTDLDDNGRCDVIDVQRVINAVTGQSCRVGI
jgi:hypothetical protein